jgi:hypothetical protein
MAERQNNGTTAEWENGSAAEWQKGRMRDLDNGRQNVITHLSEVTSTDKYIEPWCFPSHFEFL